MLYCLLRCIDLLMAGYFQAWSLFMKGQDALLRTGNIINSFKRAANEPTIPIQLSNELRKLKSFIETRVLELNRPENATGIQGTEEAAAQNLWMIARVLAHT